MPHALKDWLPMSPAARKWRWMNFSAQLAAPDEILATWPAAPQVEITTFIGTDPAPMSHILQGPVISGACVGVLLGSNPVAGATYTIEIGVYTTAGQYLSDYARQSITSL